MNNKFYSGLLKKITISLTPLSFAVIIFLLFQFIFFNINVDFRDEGFLMLNASRLLKKEIPYRDFFLTTTPLPYYFLALLTKVFGNYLVIGRIFYIAIVSAIFFLVYKIYENIPKNNNLKLIIFGSLGILFVAPGYAFYNIEGLFLYLLGFYLYNKWVEDKTTKYLFLIGIQNGILFLVKQSYGLAYFLLITFLIIKKVKFKSLPKNMLSFLLGTLVIIFPFILYLYLNKALGDFLYFVFTFSGEVKAHRIPFITTSVILIPFYLVFINILRKLSLKKKTIFFLLFFCFASGIYFLLSPQRLSRLATIIKDPLIYYYAFSILFPLTLISWFWEKADKIKEKLIISCLFLLTLFLASASSGRDYTTILIVSPIFLPLIVGFFESIKLRLFWRNLILLMIFVIYLTPFIIDRITIFNKFYSRPFFYSQINNLKYMKVHIDEEYELDNLITYIKENTNSKDRILCFPYCPLLNILAERGSASFFSFFYNETFREKDTARLLDDLSLTKPKFIIVQRSGYIEPEANFEDNRLKKAKEFIESNYFVQKTFSNFLVLSIKK